MTATWTDTDMRGDVEHECPTPLQSRADEVDAGGMVYTPAGRWESVVDVDAADRPHVTVRTDRAVWRFWGSDTMPYLPAWLAGNRNPVRVAVNEGSTSLTVYVGRGGERVKGASVGNLSMAARGRLMLAEPRS
jgi:hypothetical protein